MNNRLILLILALNASSYCATDVTVKSILEVNHDGQRFEINGQNLTLGRNSLHEHSLEGQAHAQGHLYKVILHRLKKRASERADYTMTLKRETFPHHEHVIKGAVAKNAYDKACLLHRVKVESEVFDTVS
ncbi:MAG TPA: hypothetical protein VFF04_00935 [Candidatus Babeliales bacterium]|nr:hypothetical protein [Candidatus Babeliales bacterium]